MARYVKRVDVAIDLWFDLVNRIPQSGSLAIAYGEAFGELAVVVNAKENVPAGRIGEGADFFAKLPYFRGNLSFEFYVLAFSLGNQFLYFYLVNHVTAVVTHKYTVFVRHSCYQLSSNV